jgi:hypothetical protein
MKTKICVGIIEDDPIYIENPNMIYIQSCFLNSKVLMNVQHVICSSYSNCNNNDSLIIHLNDSVNENNGGYANNVYINQYHQIEELLRTVLNDSTNSIKYCLVFNISSLTDDIITKNLSLIKEIYEKWQKTDNLLIFNETIFKIAQNHKKTTNEFFNNCFLINERDVVCISYYYQEGDSVVVNNFTSMTYLVSFNSSPSFLLNKSILLFLTKIKLLCKNDDNFKWFADEIITQQFLYERNVNNNSYTEMFYDFFMVMELPYSDINKLMPFVDNAKLTFLKIKNNSI